LPAELQRREERLQRIREAKRALEARVRQEAEATAKEPDGEGGQQNVKPEEKDQYNFTDPESRILKGPDGFLQGYNAQIAVEPVLQLIVGQAVTQAANDKKQLLPMLAAVEQQAGQKPSQVLADSGIPPTPACKEWKEPTLMLILRWLATSAIRDLAHATGTAAQRGDAHRPHAPELQTQVGELSTRRGKRLWNRCSARFKQARGFRSSCCVVSGQVQGEWALVCMAHNILKLHRLVST